MRDKPVPNSKPSQKSLTASQLDIFGTEFGTTPKCQSVYIRTFGCQMNIRDSEIILGMLQKRGYAQVESEDDADVILFNTCSVRQHAEERVWGAIGRLRQLKRQGPLLSQRTNKQPVIAVVGCMAQNYQDEILRRFPDVNLVCGPANIYDIPDLLEKVAKEDVQVLAVDHSSRPVSSDGCGFRVNPLKAFVSIMYGCNKFCSYCIVPYVRGRERSRPLKHILDEVKGLAKRGSKEITLLGQNVNSYGKDLRGKINFVRLLERLDKIEGIERIRFVTSHPKDASRQLFRAMRDLPSVCEQLHLPLQSGSNKILKLMNRGYALADYLKSVDYLRGLIPHCRLSTDIIVGFPQESEADFQKTVQAMQRIQFNQAFIFKYSPRPKTKAAKLKDDVPLKIKQQRNQHLLRLQKQISLRKRISIIVMVFMFLFSGRLLFAQSSGLKNVEALILKDAYQQAARDCEKILASERLSKIKSKAYYLLGICLLKEEEFEEARENFNIILGRYAGSKFCDEASLAIADSYFLAGDYKKASRSYEKFLQDFPHSEFTSIAQKHQKQCQQAKPLVNAYFSVQLGCFTKKTNAQKLRDRLIDNGYQAYILKLPSEDFYRVRVGKFGNRLQAELLEQQLRSEGHSTKVCP